MVSTALRLATVASAIAVPALARAEGEDLVVELAEAVLANRQEVLQIPWEFDLERDVGYVGEHPLLENSTAEAKQESLGTVREVQNGLSPNIAIGTAYIKDTMQPPAPPSVYRMGGSVGGLDFMHLSGVVNPTSDLTVWQWQRIKWFGVKTWLEMWISRYPDKLVAVHSPGDVLYGGCDETTLQYKYDQIVNASGGTQKIVLAAEMSPYPEDMGWKYNMTASLETRRQAVLSNFSVPQDWAEDYANCTGTLHSICSSPPRYQYANMGFIMGPANDVYEMLSGLDTYTGLDNRMINEYFFDNPDLVTVDYAGSLVLSLHNMVKNGETPVEVSTAGGAKVLKNKETNQKVCFVHGNGNSFDALRTLATELTS